LLQTILPYSSCSPRENLGSHNAAGQAEDTHIPKAQKEDFSKTIAGPLCTWQQKSAKGVQRGGSLSRHHGAKQQFSRVIGKR